MKKINIIQLHFVSGEFLDPCRSIYERKFNNRKSVVHFFVLCADINIQKDTKFPLDKDLKISTYAPIPLDI